MRSTQAAQAFGRDDADVVVLYRSATMTVSDPAYRQAVTAALDHLPRAAVATVTTYWSSGSSRLVSADRHATYAALQLTGGRRRRPAQDLRGDPGRALPAPASPPPG